MQLLEPGQLWVMRIRGAVAALLLALAAGGAEAMAREELGTPLGMFMVPALLIGLLLALVVPARRFSAWGYTIDGDELQVRHGRLIQVHTIVPLHRVEHIDVTQGPLERAFGVCRLIVHTAGTLHSMVVVPGLSRATAEAMRDDIRDRIRREQA